MVEGAGLAVTRPRREFRATPARVAFALRLAKYRIFVDLWHVWTDGDQQHYERRVLPEIRGEGWRSTAVIATYIFTWFRLVQGNRRDWSVEFSRAYRRSLGL